MPKQDNTAAPGATHAVTLRLTPTLNRKARIGAHFDRQIMPQHVVHMWGPIQFQRARAWHLEAAGGLRLREGNGLVAWGKSFHRPCAVGEVTLPRMERRRESLPMPRTLSVLKAL